MSSKASYEQLEQQVKELRTQLCNQRTAQQDVQCELMRALAVLGLATQIGSEQSLDETLLRIAEHCREMLELETLCIALLEECGLRVLLCTLSDAVEREFRYRQSPQGRLQQEMPSASRQNSRACERSHALATEADLEQILAPLNPLPRMPLRRGAEEFGALYAVPQQSAPVGESALRALQLAANLATAEISRSKAKESLRESEQRFRFMAETTGDVIYRLKYEHMTYDYISPGITKLTGYTESEIRAQGFSQLVSQIDIAGRENVSPQSIAKSRREGKTREYRAEYLIRTKSGETKWVRDHSFPWLDERGRLIGSVGILSDISDYKRAEARVRERTAELIESEEKYRTLVENVPLVVYRIQPGGEILFVNHFVRDLFGYSPAEIMRNPRLWDEWLYEEDRSRIQDLRKRSYVDGEEFVAEYRIIHKNGHLVYVIDHAMPLRASEGAVNNVDGIIMDVTGRVKLQEQLVRAEGLKTVSEVSARLAHEIRNPLVSAGGFARRLLETMDPADPNRGKVEIIVKEVARLETILRMILNYIQPVELHLAPVDPNTLVRAAVSDAAIDTGPTRALIDLQLSPGIAEISADRSQLKRVFTALLKNALQQMPQHSTLSISTAQAAQKFMLLMRYPTRHLARDDVEHFFYPFSTSHLAVHTPDLPMAKILINKHGGSIDVALKSSDELLITIVLPLDIRES